MKRKATDVLADVFIYVFMAVLSLLCLIPFIHVLSVSISGNGAVMSNQVFLIPKDVNLDAYKTVFGDATMMRSLWFTVFVTVAFTALGMFLTICGAFALSRKRLKGRKVIGVIFLITMYFTAGTIPDYILMSQLHLINTAAVLRIVRECSVRSSWQSLKGTDAPVISDFDAMVDYCRSAMAYQMVEEFRIIFLNSKLYVIGEEIQQRGTVDQVAIHPREVIKSAMMHGASAMILVHNHPSGIVTPSKADMEITKRIKEAAEAVSIRLFDHLIISKSSVYSFHNQGFV